MPAKGKAGKQWIVLYGVSARRVAVASGQASRAAAESRVDCAAYFLAAWHGRGRTSTAAASCLFHELPQAAPLPARLQGVYCVAYSPLGVGKDALLQHPAVLEVAAETGKSPAQVGRHLPACRL